VPAAAPALHHHPRQQLPHLPPPGKKMELGDENARTIVCQTNVYTVRVCKCLRMCVCVSVCVYV